MKALAMLPTFNERGSAAELARRLRALGLDVVVLDDASPDGTAQEAEGVEGVKVIRRRGPRGRGLAGREGYLYALEGGADFLVEMDADLSHRAEDVPKLLAAMDRCDVAVGSRRVPGGKDEERGTLRRRLTALSAAYARSVLGLPLEDPNSGFRCFSRRALEAVEPATLRSSGPSIVHEVYWRAARAGLRMKEVPIEFLERKAGRSKLSLGRLAAGWLWVLRLRLDGWRPS
ncbi:MAG TPA: dolichyl-phosphate beta-D-mannosyltransferase [Elusimicrobia bacterium]|nr:dolichyl-phosphate beta-D-mannosyltransferase [Elusimicrobiota bacterium]